MANSDIRLGCLKAALRFSKTGDFDDWDEHRDFIFEEAEKFVKFCEKGESVEHTPIIPTTTDHLLKT